MKPTPIAARVATAALTLPSAERAGSETRLQARQEVGLGRAGVRVEQGRALVAAVGPEVPAELAVAGVTHQRREVVLPGGVGVRLVVVVALVEGVELADPERHVPVAGTPRVRRELLRARRERGAA